MSADANNEKLEKLTAEVGALREELESLRAQVSSARDRIDLSMRGQTRCPACGCQKILHAREVLDRGDGDTRKKLALAKPGFWRSKVVGQFEAYLCTECGLVEWYARDLHEVEVDGDIFRILDSNDAGGQGPYR